jgi:hypothetical protein
LISFGRSIGIIVTWYVSVDPFDEGHQNDDDQKITIRATRFSPDNIHPGTSSRTENTLVTSFIWSLTVRGRLCRTAVSRLLRRFRVSVRSLDQALEIQNAD